MGMRKVTITAAAALAAILSTSAGAIAAASYTVKLKAPSYPNAGSTFHLRATGTAGSSSHLTVVIGGKRCAPSLASETARAPHVIISKSVHHSYALSKSIRAKQGTHHICAYLTPAGHSSVTRAHASKTYYGLVGAY